MTKFERNAALLKMLADHSPSEVAKHFGITRQRVYELAEQNKVPVSRDKHETHVLIPLIGTMKDRDLAKLHPISAQQIHLLRKKYKLPVYKIPIGCPDCETKPYAKGMCRKCYNRNNRREKVEL